jgi:DNA-binding CsgD family transcriptional regulator
MSWNGVWTEQMQAMLEQLAAEDKSAREIGQALGVSRNAVIGRAGRTAVQLRFKRPPAAPRPPRQLRPRVEHKDPASRAARKASRREARDIARAMYLAGDTYASIAAETGYSITYIGIVTKGLPRRRPAAVRTGVRYGLGARVAMVADILAGDSAACVSRRWGATETTLAKYLTDPSVIHAAMARSIEILSARCLVAGADGALAALSARDEAESRDLINRPILADMSPRDREAMLARIAGETLEQIGRRHGITRERVRQIEVKWRCRGLQIPGATPLSAAAERMALARKSTGHRPGRPARRPEGDFFAAAHAILAAEIGGKRKPYRVSDEERARRAERMRKVSRAYWEGRA